MIAVFNDISVNKFSVNGAELFKTFIAVRVTDNAVKIVDIYDDDIRLYDAINVSDVEVNGVVYATVAELITAIAPVLYIPQDSGTINEQQILINKANIEDLQLNKANKVHNHNTLYYLKHEIDSMLSNLPSGSGFSYGLVDGKFLRFYDANDVLIHSIDCTDFVNQATSLDLQGDVLLLKNNFGQTLDSVTLSSDFLYFDKHFTYTFNSASELDLSSATEPYIIVYLETENKYFFAHNTNKDFTNSVFRTTGDLSNRFDLDGYVMQDSYKMHELVNVDTGNDFTNDFQSFNIWFNSENIAYNHNQTLTPAQQEQAKKNIGLDNSKEVVDFKDYGAVGDGTTENNTAFIAAVQAASEQNKSLYIPPGEYLITYGLGTIDMGNSTGLVGKGTLKFETVSEDKPILEFKGEVKQVSSATSIVLGERSSTVNTGEDIAVGDTVFLISNELLDDGNVRYPYKKGQRLSVRNYNADTGEITFNELYDDSITEGYFFHNNVRPRITIEGVKVVANTPVDKKGIQVTFAEVQVNDVVIEDFQRLNLNINHCLADINFLRTDAKTFAGTNTSYGLQISGLSLAYTDNSTLVGGRHGMTHGDVSTLGYNFFGEVCFYSSISHVRNTSFNSYGAEASLDSHKNTKLLTLTNCYAYNGAILGGKEVVWNIGKIDIGTSGLRIQRDNLDPNTAYGKIHLNDLEITSSKTLFRIIDAPELLKVTNSRLISTSGVDVFGIYDDSGHYIFPENIEFQNVEIVNTTSTSINALFYKRKKIKLENITTIGVSISVRKQTEDENVDFPVEINNIVSNRAYYGVIISELNSSINIKNCKFYNSEIYGVFSIRNKKITLNEIYVENAQGNFGVVRLIGENSSAILKNVEVSGTTNIGIRLTSEGNFKVSLKDVKSYGNTNDIGLEGNPTVEEWLNVQTSDGVSEYKDVKFLNPTKGVDAVNDDEFVTKGQVVVNSDSGWQDVTLDPAYVSSGTLQVKLKNGRLIFYGNINFQTTSNNTVIGTIPVGYRPDAVRMIKAYLTLTASYMFKIDTDGNLYTTNPAGATVDIDQELTQNIN